MLECPSGSEPLSQHIEQKHYRLSAAYGYNFLDDSFYERFGALKLVFSAISPAPGADIELIFGSLD